jgi:hypothetical protein
MGTFEPVLAILTDAETSARLQLTPIHPNHLPEKHFVQACQAGKHVVKSDLA